MTPTPDCEYWVVSYDATYPKRKREFVLGKNGKRLRFSSRRIAVRWAAKRVWQFPNPKAEPAKSE
jgi:hypothetical protein